jgi:hypothetical protein
MNKGCRIHPVGRASAPVAWMEARRAAIRVRSWSRPGSGFRYAPSRLRLPVDIARRFLFTSNDAPAFAAEGKKWQEEA